MGKLAERFTDVNRSGVYRVRDARIPRAAALEACAYLLEADAAPLASIRTRLQSAFAAEDVRICVLLVSGAPSWATRPGEEIAALHETAQVWRAAGRSFFAVLVDPAGALALPPLYHEKPDAGIKE